MKINTERLLRNLETRWNRIPCPYCQNSAWTVDPSVVTTVEVNENKTMVIGGKFQPLVPVTCRNCGNTVLVNALILDCLEDVENEGEKRNNE